MKDARAHLWCLRNRHYILYKSTLNTTQPKRRLYYEENHYKTNLHTHSTYSDANNTMADMIFGFYDNDFDILAFAEHGIFGKEWDKEPTKIPLFTFQYLWHGKKVHPTTEQYHAFLNGTYKTPADARTKKRGLMCVPDAIELNMFTPIKILDYTVTPLRARHAEHLNSMIYIIRSENKNILWAHDTGKFPADTVEYLKNSGIVFDFISLDCTLKRNAQITGAHMDLDWCVEMTELLRENGNVNDNTKVVLSHIGHLVERTHDELQKEADDFNMTVAYDGMSVCV